MSGAPTKPTADLDEETPFDGDLGELPPLDGGETGDAEYALPPFGEEDPVVDDGEDDDLLETERLKSFAEEICDYEPPPLESGGEEETAVSIDIESFEEAPDAEPADDALEDGWFSPDADDGAVAPDDDGGAEGLLDAESEQLPAQLPPLEDGDMGDEDIGELAGVDPADRAPAPLDEGEGPEDEGGVGDLDARYCGPSRGRVAGVAHVDGALFAAGDGLYRMGADALLHRYDAEEDVGALTVAEAGGGVFLGTERRGLLHLGGLDGLLSPRNDWCATRSRARASDSGVSVSFRVFASACRGAIRLHGLTGEGRLYASDDLGVSWRGPILEHRCLAASPIEGSDAVLALVAIAGEAALLRIDADGGIFRVGLPRTVSAFGLISPVSIAANEGVVALAVDRPEAPLFVSLDGGARFTEVSAVSGATAIAVDAHEPGFVAAATYHRERDLGLVLTSGDGGATWRVAFAVGRAEDREERIGSRGRVHALSVQGDGPRRIVAVAGDGVYCAELRARRPAH